MTKAYAYYRTSSDDGPDKAGIPGQQCDTEAFAEKADFQIVQTFIDDGISGKKFHMHQRPAGRQLIAALLADGVKVVLCDKGSRIGRQQQTFWSFAGMCRDNDVTIIDAHGVNLCESVQGGFNGLMAEMEYDQTVSRLKRGKEFWHGKKRVDGRWPYVRYEMAQPLPRPEPKIEVETLAFDWKASVEEAGRELAAERARYYGLNEKEKQERKALSLRNKTYFEKYGKHFINTAPPKDNGKLEELKTGWMDEWAESLKNATTLERRYRDGLLRETSKKRDRNGFLPATDRARVFRVPQTSAREMRTEYLLGHPDWLPVPMHSKDKAHFEYDRPRRSYNPWVTIRPVGE